jgi:fatty acid synthase subunit beta
MKSIFPAAIDGDLLKLVHLSNGFRMLDRAKPLRVGDVCHAEADIASFTNTDAGKVVKVKGHVYRAGEPVVEIVSSFLYRGRFTDYDNTFETTEKPDYLVDLADHAAVEFCSQKSGLSGMTNLFPCKLGQLSFSECTPKSPTRTGHLTATCPCQATFLSVTS